MCKYLSFDIGGTAIKYAVLDDDNVIESGSTDTQAHLGGERVVANVKALIEKYKEEYSLNAVAISTAGMVDCKKGEVFLQERPCRAIPVPSGRVL